MTANPYSAPIDHAADADVPKSFARRLSLALAGLGFFGFWGTLIVCAVRAAATRLDTSIGMVVGVAMLLAIGVHIVAITVTFAAVPDGRRLLPALLNAIPLAILVALIVVAMTEMP